MKSKSFYIITDSHYLSKKHWVEGVPFTRRIREDSIAINHTPEILDAYLDAVIADKDTDTVLFLGDNVDNGDMTSHYEFRERLEKLTAAGKKVYMLYATHDYIGAGDDECCFQKPRRFTETGTEPVDFMRKAQLPEFYFDYTRKNAYSVHKESGSYCVKLADNLVMIFIIDNGNGRSYCGLFDDGLEWLEAEIKSAQKSGMTVMLCTHHPVLPPWKIYEKVAPHEMFGSYKKLWDIMCRCNVRLIFTGHTHVQSIQKHTDKNGNWFYAVSTIALAHCFGKMRKVTVDCDTGKCEIISIQKDIEKAVGTTREELYKQNFSGIWETLLPLAHSDYKQFIEQSDGYIKKPNIPKKYRFIIKPVSRQLDKISLYKAAGLAGVKRKLTDSEKEYAKNNYVKTTLFEILRHFFSGNAPFTPDTLEYRIATGITHRIDRLNIKKLKNYLSELTVTDVAEDFLYNDRTGDDDSISINMK